MITLLPPIGVNVAYVPYNRWTLKKENFRALIISSLFSVARYLGGIAIVA